MTRTSATSASKATLKHDRRQAIGEVAMTLFRERGVAATRVEDILERADASNGSFYHHFGSKLNLAVILYLETLQRFQGDLLDELERHEGARDGIESVVRRYLRWAAENPTAMRYMMHCREPSVASASEGKEAALNKQFYEQLIRWLQRHIDAGEIVRLLPEQYYALWIGPAHQLVRSAINELDYFAKPDPESYVRHLQESEQPLVHAAWQVLKKPVG
jgi:AcrR family transcriptional regulator